MAYAAGAEEGRGQGPAASLVSPPGAPFAAWALLSLPSLPRPLIGKDAKLG